MTEKKSDWTPDKEAALKALIRATVMNAGPIDPDDIPHKVKEKIRAQASGDMDVDEYIKEVIAEAQKGK